MLTTAISPNTAIAIPEIRLIHRKLDNASLLLREVTQIHSVSHHSAEPRKTPTTSNMAEK